jgi:hypothetical protein
VGLLETDDDPDEERLNGYLATLSVLDLVVQVFWPYDSKPGSFDRPPHFLPCIRRIWPIGDSFIWPPGPALTSAGLAGISGPPPK